MGGSEGVWGVIGFFFFRGGCSYLRVGVVRVVGGSQGEDGVGGARGRHPDGLGGGGGEKGVGGIKEGVFTRWKVP